MPSHVLLSWKETMVLSQHRLGFMLRVCFHIAVWIWAKFFPVFSQASHLWVALDCGRPAVFRGAAACFSFAESWGHFTLAAAFLCGNCVFLPLTATSSMPLYVKRCPQGQRCFMLCCLTSISPFFFFDICKARLKMCAFSFFFCFSLLLPPSVCLCVCLSLSLYVCVCVFVCVLCMSVCVCVCLGVEWGWGDGLTDSLYWWIFEVWTAGSPVEPEAYLSVLVPCE